MRFTPGRDRCRFGRDSAYKTFAEIAAVREVETDGFGSPLRPVTAQGGRINFARKRFRAVGDHRYLSCVSTVIIRDRVRVSRSTN